VEFILRDAHFTKLAHEGTSLGREGKRVTDVRLVGGFGNDGAWVGLGVLLVFPAV
jgi:hypothetical protein